MRGRCDSRSWGFPRPITVKSQSQSRVSFEFQTALLYYSGCRLLSCSEIRKSPMRGIRADGISDRNKLALGERWNAKGRALIAHVPQFSEHTQPTPDVQQCNNRTCQKITIAIQTQGKAPRTRTRPTVQNASRPPCAGYPRTSLNAVRADVGD